VGINRYGNVSRLSIGVRKGGGGAVLDECSFTAPFKITSPFYTGGGRMRIMVLSVSAGIMAGDEQRIRVRVRKGAELEIASQSFEKIHRMNEPFFARRDTELWVESGALLVYAPLPAIPFAGSAFEGSARIHLEDASSRLAYSEILSCGRAAAGERFKYRYYKNRVAVYEGGRGFQAEQEGGAERLVYADNSVYTPGETDLEGFCMFEAYTHLSALLLVNIPVSMEQREGIAREAGDFPGIAGVSDTGSGALYIRGLGRSAEDALALHDKLLGIVM
jgi:urease accessory protein